ncbi:MAG: GAF domain-containing protein [Desulfovibrionaceae bacterium]
MAKIRLKRLLADQHIIDIITIFVPDMAAGNEEQLAVFDELGRLLMGPETATGTDHDIRTDGQRLGVVRGGPKAKAVARLLSYLAGLEVEKRAIGQETLERYKEISLLYRLGESVAATVDPAEVGRIVIEEADKIFHADTVSIMLRDEASGGYRLLYASEGQTNGPSETIKIQSPLKAEILADAATCSMLPNQAAMQSMMCAPLKVKDKVLGLVNVGSTITNAFNAGDLKLLAALAAQVAAPLESARLYDKQNAILKTFKELGQISDLDTLMDTTLLEARRLCGADAGSIFLAEGDQLTFSYVHNDTLFTGDAGTRAVYSTYSMPIDETTLVGYAALTGKTVVIEDAYKLPPDVPYTFDKTFDVQSGYRTCSVLTLPLLGFQNRLMGVMQLVNAKNDEGRSVPFGQESLIYLPLFANNASVALERGIMTREQILRMMMTAELRDPSETGAHVQRVGAYSAEIYQRWALNWGLGMDRIKLVKGNLRLASMLHDVGKVGISDAILKKPTKLTSDEFDTMKWHTVFGARLFSRTTSDLDAMCYDVALNHHERWDGRGYPGVRKYLEHGGEVVMETPKRGEEIPLPARITALADVYDALRSRRSYKEPWPEQQILDVIEQESGKHFDPAIVESFFNIYDTIRAIADKFQD